MFFHCLESLNVQRARDTALVLYIVFYTIHYTPYSAVLYCSVLHYSLSLFLFISIFESMALLIRYNGENGNICLMCVLDISLEKNSNKSVKCVCH